MRRNLPTGASAKMPSSAEERFHHGESQADRCGLVCFILKYNIYFELQQIYRYLPSWTIRRAANMVLHYFLFFFVFVRW